jgi:hypothetical protein
MDMLLPNLISPSLKQMAENEPFSTGAESAWFVGFIVLGIVYFICFIGLFFFKKWARAGALYSTVMSLCLYPFFGVSVMSGWAVALDEASMVLWGAVLAIAYFSPLQSQFISSRVDFTKVP